MSRISMASAVYPLPPPATRGGTGSAVAGHRDDVKIGAQLGANVRRAGGAGGALVGRPEPAPGAEAEDVEAPGGAAVAVERHGSLVGALGLGVHLAGHLGERARPQGADPARRPSPQRREPGV